MTGTAAIAAFAVIAFQASSPIRHAFYEMFLHLHIALAVLTVVFLWMHLDGKNQQSYLLAAIVTWAFVRFRRLFSFMRSSVGRQGTEALVEVLPGDAVRVSVSLARKVSVRPGSHMYLYIPSVGLWTSHPYSVVWSDTELPHRRNSFDSHDIEKHPLPSIDPDPDGRQTLSAVIRRRTGFTDALYRKALKLGAVDGNKMALNAFVETGYGLSQPVLFSCGTVLLFAGGVGITHQIPYVRALVQGYANATAAACRVVLVWVTQSPEHLEWIRPWMTQILAMEKRREVLMVKVFITRPPNAKEVHSPSETVQMFPGRPDVWALIRSEAEAGVGCLGVSVCGPGELSDEVRRCVRRLGVRRNVEFVEESFGW